MTLHVGIKFNCIQIIIITLFGIYLYHLLLQHPNKYNKCQRKQILNCSAEQIVLLKIAKT